MDGDVQCRAGGRKTSLSDSPYAPAVTELLDTLDGKDLESLASTATSGRLMPENRKEAMEIILLYTENLARLFSYKRITTQTLMKYLHKKRVSVSSKANKLEVIKAVEEELEKPVQKSISEVATRTHTTPEVTNRMYTTPEVTPRTLTTPEVIPRTLTTPEVTNRMYTTPEVTHRTYTTPEATPRIYTTPDPAYQQRTPPSPSISCTLTPSGSVNINGTGVNVSLDVRPGGVCSNASDDMSEVFAREFCSWFYTMVNRLQPEGSHLPGDMLNAEAFVGNACLDLYLYSGQQVMEKHALGQQDAFTTLRDTLVACNVCFAPDITSGMNCEMSGSGMAKLQCRGTLHRQEVLVGVFEQEFGLVVCPEGSWKVAVLKSNLRQHVASV